MQLGEGLRQRPPVRDAARRDKLKGSFGPEVAHEGDGATGGQRGPELNAAPHAVHRHGDQGHAGIRHRRLGHRSRRRTAARQRHRPLADARRPSQKRRLRAAKARLRDRREQIPEVEEAGIGAIHAGAQAQRQAFQRRRKTHGRSIPDDRGRSAARDQALTQRARRQVRVERDELRVDLGAGKRNHGPLDAVAATHGDHVVMAQTTARERIRQHVGILVPVAIGQRRRSFEQRRMIATRDRPVFKAASNWLVQALREFRTFATRLSRMCDRET